MITKSLDHINKRNSCKTLKTQNIKLNSGKNGKRMTEITLEPSSLPPDCDKKRSFFNLFKFKGRNVLFTNSV